MSARCASLLVVITLVILALLPGSGDAQELVVYDDFSSGELSLGEPPEEGRWFTFEYVTRFAHRSQLGAQGWPNRIENPLTRHPIYSASNVSSRRRIVGGQLQLQLESAGGSHPDPDVAPGHGRIGVIATDRPFFTGQNIVRATVTPIAAEAPACRGTVESRVGAQLVVRILETWQDFSRRPVFATLSLERSSFGGDRIHAVLSRCRDDAVNWWDRAFVGCAVIQRLRSVSFNRTWTMGSAHTLTIQYQPDSDEPDNSRLLFTVAGGGVASETRVMTRVPPDGQGGRHFDLQVETIPAHCPASGDAPAERVGVTMDARFDNIRVGGQ
jgi:hypothetical protein